MNPNLQPSLNGELISLRPMVESDFEDLYAVSSDPLIWEQHFEPTRCQRDVFLRFFEGGMKSRGAFVVIENVTGLIVGTSRYDRYDEKASEIEIGYTFLAKRFWQRGYNRELKKLMIDYAFTFVTCVSFYVYEKNFRSQAAVLKLGAVKTGEINGGHHLSFIYQIKKENWARSE